MSKQPVVVAEWPKNSRELFRVSLGSYKANPILDFRVWYRRGQDDELRPGKTGITVAAWHVEKIAEAFVSAATEARKRGLLDVGEGDQ